MPEVSNVRVGASGNLTFNEGTDVTTGSPSAPSTPSALPLVSIVTGSNLGSGHGLFAGANGDTKVVMEFRSIKAGSGVLIADTANEIVISSTGGGGSALTTINNLGNGYGVFKDMSGDGTTLDFRTLRSNDNRLVLTQTVNEIDLSLALPNFGSAASLDAGLNPSNVLQLDAGGKIPSSVLTLGTAAALDVGTDPNDVVQLDATGKIAASIIPGLGTAASRDVGTLSGQVVIVQAGGKIDASIIPPISITSVTVVATIAARDAITGQRTGDTAIITQTNETYVWAGQSWVQILTPSPVVSVNGKSGSVTLGATDIAGFATVARSGSYVDLTNKPTLPSKTTDFTDVASAAPTDKQVLQFVAATSKWTATTLALGETNTYSSLGTQAADGEPVTTTKTGVDLPFKRIKAASAGLTVTGAANSVVLDLGATVVQKTAPNVYTAQQNIALNTMVFGATLAWDLNVAQVAMITLTGNATLANPTNMVAGGTYILIVKQDGTGNRTLAYGTAYKWPDATAPTLSTAANSTNILTFICDGVTMFGAGVTNYI